MSTLRSLKVQALESAQWRGHTMARFHALHSRTHAAHCAVCLAYVYVTPKPYPNEIDIGGSAVAVNCEVAQ